MSGCHPAACSAQDLVRFEAVDGVGFSTVSVSASLAAGAHLRRRRSHVWLRTSVAAASRSACVRRNDRLRSCACLCVSAFVLVFGCVQMGACVSLSSLPVMGRVERVVVVCVGSGERGMRMRHMHAPAYFSAMEWQGRDASSAASMAA